MAFSTRMVIVYSFNFILRFSKAKLYFRYWFLYLFLFIDFDIKELVFSQMRWNQKERVFASSIIEYRWNYASVLGLAEVVFDLWLSSFWKTNQLAGKETSNSIELMVFSAFELAPVTVGACRFIDLNLSSHRARMYCYYCSFLEPKLAFELVNPPCPEFWESPVISDSPHLLGCISWLLISYFEFPWQF